MGAWGDAADLALAKVCNERRKLKSCGCKGRGKRGNPCTYAMKIRDAALRLDEGKERETDDPYPSDILAWVNTRRCTHSRNGDTSACKHGGCEKAESLVLSLSLRIGGVSEADERVIRRQAA